MSISVKASQSNFVLTAENYYSQEANRRYMSVSQYKDFIECEAMAMAKLSGWEEPKTDALLVGSYVHSYFEGPQTFERFKAENPDIYSSRGQTKGELKAQYKVADTMIAALENDEFCMFALEGEQEVIMTAEMYGADWKIKIDRYAPDAGRFVDVKAVKSIRDKVWDAKYGYVSFVEAYGYVLQMAVYCEVERRNVGRSEWLEPLLVAVSKEDPPDKAIISFPEHRLMLELQELEERMPRVLAVKAGLEPPIRCERCRYCRETKKVTRVISFTDLLDV